MSRQPRAARRPDHRIFPLPATHAHRVLTYIRDNPGVSTNRVITALGLNPAVARKCLTSLISHGAIEDKIVGGNHAYSAKGKL